MAYCNKYNIVDTNYFAIYYNRNFKEMTYCTNITLQKLNINYFTIYYNN